MKTTRRKKLCTVPVALTWSHSGVAFRVTPWPEVQFERRYGEDWIRVTPSMEALASASMTFTEKDWNGFLEYAPSVVREFLGGFSFTRIEALQVAARCPTLLTSLTAVPALTAFVASHADLRDLLEPCWSEVEAVHERSGVYGVLQWLGLPTSRQTIAILQHVVSPDVPKRFLAPLRSLLWEPRMIFALQKETVITDRLLDRYCHALAA